MSRFTRIALLAASASVAGCLDFGGSHRLVVGHDLRDPGALRRINSVAFVELAHDERNPAVAETLTQSIAQSLKDTRLFRVRLVRRDDPVCHDLDFSDPHTFSMAQLLVIRQALKADAVLCGSMKHFQPYPRMRVGVYLAMIDLDEGSFVWGVDHRWDTTDKATRKRIARFYRDNVGADDNPDGWRTGLVSPALFAKFVAHEVARTLPARIAAP